MPIHKIPIQEFIAFDKTAPVLDVRSPGEYAYAHMPHAISFPVFDDAQRKEIGTTYKQVSREDAIKTGLRFFGPKMHTFIEQVEKILKQRQSNQKKLLVHCWRGGMRSGAMAWLLSFYGFEVYLLEGGYKAYRHWVLEQLDQPFEFYALGGFTGSAKTEVLQELSRQGFPVIDLEAIAAHKGSAFGSMGMPAQPSQEFFENVLADKLQPFYKYTPEGLFKQTHKIWIENESRRIGLINLTDTFYQQMQSAPLYTLNIPFEERLQFITKQYGSFERDKLVNAIIRIQKRLGGLDTKNAINFLVENNITECFRILLSYYDKQYKQSLESSHRKAVVIESNVIDPSLNAKLILQAFNTATT